MDKKQKSIFYRLLEKFDLPRKNTFVQFRNLNEFKYFKIEKINPTHRILLYGKLKNDKSKKFIKVGEILIGEIVLTLNVNLILSNINSICLFINIFFLSSIFYYIISDENILKVIYEKAKIFIIPKTISN